MPCQARLSLVRESPLFRLMRGPSRHRELFFFFNDTATTEIYTLSLHDALPIHQDPPETPCPLAPTPARSPLNWAGCAGRSEEHTSELQSRRDLVCRLLLEK